MIRVRRGVGILMLLVSLVFLLWGIWPQATRIRTVPLSPNPFTPSVTSNIPYVFENHLLVLEWTPRLRAGDAGSINLKIIKDQQVYPSPTSPKGEGESTIESYENQISPTTENTIVEARLDMMGLQYSPTGEIREAYREGQPVMFLWSVRAPKEGTYRGTIWLHARSNSQVGGGEIRSVLSAPRLEIVGNKILGLGGIAARVLGSVGVVVGSMLGLDGLFAWLWNFFIDKLKPGSTS